MALPSPLYLSTQNTFETAVQHHQHGDYSGAEALYRAVLETAPGHPLANAYLGVLLCQTGRTAEGVAFLETAHMLDPDDAETLINLGNACRIASLIDRSLETLKRAVRLAPLESSAWANLGASLVLAGRSHSAVAHLRKAVELDPANLGARSDLLLTMLYDPEASKDAEREAAEFGKLFAPVPPVRPDRRLRTIAFLSGHFGNHPVGFFLEGLLRTIDRSRYRVVALVNQTAADAQTQCLRALFDEWFPVASLDDDALEALTRQVDVDALIDLEGHTAKQRVTALSRRLAPLQVNWLGFSGTSGLPFHDLLIGDPTVTPAREDARAVERVARLPRSFVTVPFGRLPAPRVIPPVSQNGLVTFGSFANVAKLSEETVALWARILHAVPGSRLLLKSAALGNPGVAADVVHRFAEHHVHGSRIAVRGLIECRDEHLEAYCDVDVALDTVPYTGATTTVEALAMGVPVVTLEGARYSARMSASLLRTAGLEDWVAQTPDEYVAKAVALAREAAANGLDRLGLRARLEASPLADLDGFARAFEAALETAWEGTPSA